MTQQYVATDKESGLQVTVQGEFPPDPDDRMRIARTTTLFTRLMATILGTEDEAVRQMQFHAIEAQMEVGAALLRGDMGEAQRLIRSTLARAGVTEEHLDMVEAEFRSTLFGRDDEESPDSG